MPHGADDATIDPDRARQWWKAAPRVNVGIALGERAGLFVLDIDPRSRGDCTLVDLLLQHGGLGGTLESFTGSGGSHYFFAWPQRRVPNLTGGLGPGVDVKGDGGYVVAPPSLHASGFRYYWPGRCGPIEPVLPAPRWVLERVVPRAERLGPPRPLVSTRPTTPHGGADIVPRAAAYLARIDPAISGAGGHRMTMRAGLALVRGFALDGETAFWLLLTEYNPRWQPRWSERELRHKVASATQSAVRVGYLLEGRRA